MLRQEHVLLLHDRHAIDQQFRAARVVRKMLVGIGHIADRRHHERNFGGLFADARHHPERNVVFVAVLRCQLRSIELAARALRNGPFETGRPACIVDIIIMKVDRAILLGSTLPVEGLPLPVISGHGASRAIHDGGMKQVWSLVFAKQRVDAVTEIPRRHDSLGQLTGRAGIATLREARLRAHLHGFNFEPAQCAIADARRVYLAIVVTLDQYPGWH